MNSTTLDAPPKKQLSGSKSKHQNATHEEIASRAYDLFILRGGSDGLDVQDWLQAEKELERT